MSDMTIGLTWSIGALALVVSSLLARQLPMKDWVKMALAWVAIFGLVFLVIRTVAGGDIIAGRSKPVSSLDPVDLFNIIYIIG